MSLTELMAQRAELDQQIAASQAAIFEGTVTEIVCSAEASGVPLDKLAAALLSRAKKNSRKTKKPAAKPVAAKYAQLGGDATWSGRGVQPRWFKAGDYRIL